LQAAINQGDNEPPEEKKIPDQTPKRTLPEDFPTGGFGILAGKRANPGYE
jgi:hypothetical protein